VQAKAKQEQQLWFSLATNMTVRLGAYTGYPATGCPQVATLSPLLFTHAVLVSVHVRCQDASGQHHTGILSIMACFRQGRFRPQTIFQLYHLLNGRVCLSKFICLFLYFCIFGVPQ
jgi:hypothetical protein